MAGTTTDDAEYRFLSASNAALKIRLAVDDQGQPELQVFGNRAGLLSLANILLWFVANAWRREFLSLTELPFVHAEAPLSVCLRLVDVDATGQDGALFRTDRGEQFEWAIPEDDLKRLALLVHRRVSNPCHEYDRLLLAEGSEAGVHVRMVDTVE